MRILCTTLTLPWIRDPHLWEQQLAEALGGAVPLRWAISRVEGELAVVEAVVTVAEVAV